MPFHARRSLCLTTIVLLTACDDGSMVDETNAGTGGMVASATSTSAVGGSGGSTNTGGSTTGGSTSSQGPVTSVTCSVVPVNPNATQQAKNLLCYLYNLKGLGVLSGQQETSWDSNPAVDVEWILAQTGKSPAVLGGDYLYPGAEGQNGQGTTTRAIAWWNAGGIPLIRYHMGAPPNTDTYDNSKGTADLTRVITSGTSENTSFISKLNYVAAELSNLQSANVAVLWAPFHEVQSGGWFWWAKGTAEQFVALWRYTYDYLTTTKGLNNLIWLLPYSSSPTGSYYPGDDVVDLTGADTYDTGRQPFAALYQSTASIARANSPVPLHETGEIVMPDGMFPSTAPWVLFNVWAGYENGASASTSEYNTLAEIQSAYASPYTVTRDEVPSLK